MIAPHAYRTSVWFCFCGTTKTTSEYLRAKTSISLNLDNLHVASSSPQFLICRNRNLVHHNSWISTRLETYYKCERLCQNGIQNTVSSPFLLPGAWKLSFVNVAWARSSRMLKTIPKPSQKTSWKQDEREWRALCCKQKANPSQHFVFLKIHYKPSALWSNLALLLLCEETAPRALSWLQTTGAIRFACR
jgi:hypothetical protein